MKFFSLLVFRMSCILCLLALVHGAMEVDLGFINALTWTQHPMRNFPDLVSWETVSTNSNCTNQDNDEFKYQCSWPSIINCVWPYLSAYANKDKVETSLIKAQNNSFSSNRHKNINLKMCHDLIDSFSSNSYPVYEEKLNNIDLEDVKPKILIDRSKLKAVVRAVPLKLVRIINDYHLSDNNKILIQIRKDKTQDLHSKTPNLTFENVKMPLKTSNQQYYKNVNINKNETIGTEPLLLNLKINAKNYQNKTTTVKAIPLILNGFSIFNHETDFKKNKNVEKAVFFKKFKQFYKIENKKRNQINLLAKNKDKIKKIKIFQPFDNNNFKTNFEAVKKINLLTHLGAKTKNKQKQTAGVKTRNKKTIINKDLFYHNNEEKKATIKIIPLNKSSVYRNNKEQRTTAKAIPLAKGLHYRNNEEQRTTLKVISLTKSSHYRNNQEQRTTVKAIPLTKSSLYRNNKEQRSTVKTIKLTKDSLYRDNEKQRTTVKAIPLAKGSHYRNNEEQRTTVKTVLLTKGSFNRDNEEQRTTVKAIPLTKNLLYRNNKEQKTTVKTILLTKGSLYRNNEKQRTTVKAIPSKKGLLYRTNKEQRTTVKTIPLTKSLVYRNNKEKSTTVKAIPLNKGLKKPLKRKTIKINSKSMLSNAGKIQIEENTTVKAVPLKFMYSHNVSNAASNNTRKWPKLFNIRPSNSLPLLKVNKSNKFLVVRSRGRLIKKEKISQDCGGNFTALSGTLQSPDFPLFYPNHRKCKYNIVLEQNYTIKLACNNFNLQDDKNCTHDFLYVSLNGNYSFSSNDKNEFNIKFCGDQLPPTVSSINNRMSLYFESDDMFRYPGFSCHYRAIKPNGNAVSNSFGLETDSVDEVVYDENFFKEEATKCANVANGKMSQLNNAGLDQNGFISGNIGNKGGLWNGLCGVSNVDETTPNRIIGGVSTKQHQYPWIVSILRKCNQEFCHICAGTIIANEWILTSAHCVASVPTSMLAILLGNHDFYSISEEQKFMKVAEKIVHPDYNQPTLLNNDISLLRLEYAVFFTKFISPLCLPSIGQSGFDLEQNNENSANFEADGTDIVGKTATILGWGLTKDDAEYSDGLRETKIEILDNDYCNSLYNMMTENMMCTSGSEGKGPCYGDSGGPALVRNKDGSYVQVGIMSFGALESCEAGYPSGQVLLFKFVDWIQHITKSVFH